MKKRILVFTALLMCCAPVWAQTINDKSTLDECLTYLNDVLSGIKRQVVAEVKIEKTISTNTMFQTVKCFPVDWAGLSRVEFGEATGQSIPIKLVFDRIFAQEEIHYKKMTYGDPTTLFRNIFKSNIIDLNLPIDKKDQASSLETAFMRLAHLTSKISDRTAADAKWVAYAQSAPMEDDFYFFDMTESSWLADWRYFFIGYWHEDYEQYDGNTLVFEKLDKNNKPTGEKAWVSTRYLRDIYLEGSDIVFQGSFDYAKNASRHDRPEMLKVFKVPLIKPDLEQSKKEAVLRHFRFQNWRYAGGLLKDGFKPGQKVYND